MNRKITEHHLNKPAYIYVRQSTLAQVRHHQESTERQYALRHKAIALGWREPAIRTLDRDLGMSGAQMTGREDFKTLVADVSMGQVGAVFALEASRLARSNLDWHRLLELCALTGTLVIDEDGEYDPADFNDSLILGFKGNMAQAELHILRGRLQGAKLNKAKKGELRVPLPVGFRHDDQNLIVPDPDAEVRGAVALVFKLFRETGSAYGVVHQFAQRGLRFPKRAYGGAWNGKLIWCQLTHGRVLGLLKNPSYAGTYVFGRFQQQKRITPDGEIRKQTRAVAMSSWRVNLPSHHEGYLSWEEFIENQERLAKNRTNSEEAVLSGPAREGMALLQGIVLCGHCGRRLSVRYGGSRGHYPVYVCCRKRGDGLATKDCFQARCDRLDPAISAEVVKALQPAELELAVAVMQEMEVRDTAILRQWQMRIERAEYEAALAERRYQEIDPSYRLVAATLEQRWNTALIELEKLKQQYDEFTRREARVTTPEQKAKVLALARSLPKLWQAPTTQAKDRKRMLRLLIKDITVEVRKAPKQAILHIRWQGGATTDVAVNLPLRIADQKRYPTEVIELVRDLNNSLPSAQIAERLNREGLTTPTGLPYTAKSVQWIRWRYDIPLVTLKQENELTLYQVAELFGVSTHVVHYWIDCGLLQTRKLSRTAPLWMTIDSATEKELRDWVLNSSRIQKLAAHS